MPISTLLAKSIPSTNSRKPCTKCWRDISPSQTMSMPASSCHLTASNVASSLAAASSSPCSRHCGHSLFGSASQEGFGRLPATVEGNNILCGLETLWRPPTIEPIVARAQLFSAHSSHRQIAHEGFRPRQPINARLATGGLLGAHRPVPTRALIGAERVGRIIKILGKHVSEHGSIFDRHCGALSEKRQHRVGGIPDQRHRQASSAEWDLAVKERPFQPTIRNCNKRTRLFRPGPADKVAEHLRAIAVGRPARLIPLVANNADNVDETAGLHRVVDQMRVVAKPEMNKGLAKFRWHRLDRDEGAPGRAVPERRRLLTLQALSNC